MADAGVTPDFFIDPDNKNVFKTILRYKGQYGQVPTLGAIMTDFPTYKFVKVHDPMEALLDKMRELHTLALLEEGLAESVDAHEESNATAALEALARTLSRIAAAVPNARDTDLTQTGQERLARYLTLKDLPDGLRGIPTGFRTIDRATQGLQKEQLVTFVGPPKAGKAQPLDTPVLTPSGWVKMGELVVGDSVVSGDGKPVEVIAIHERGAREVFRVTLDDGTSTRACADHLWTVNPHGLSKRTVDTLALKKNVEKNKRYGMLPVVAPVQFDKRHAGLPVHPYLLGLLIGDGGLTQSTPILTTPDAEIIEAARSLMPAGMVANPTGKMGYRFGKVNGNREGGRQKSPLTAALDSLGLMGLGSLDKFIPEQYKFASEEDRRDILAGLLDTDGGMEGNSVSYCTVSSRLAEDIRDLVLSLGGCARINTKQPYYRGAQGERLAGKQAYVLKMRLPYGNPFRLARKADKFNDHATNLRPPTRRVVSVEPEGIETVRCITVANPDGLYVTENYIVTHNSTLLLLAAIAAHLYGVKPLFIGFEMSNEEQEERYDAIRAGISHARLRNGTLKKAEWDKLERALREIENMPSFFLSSDSMNATTLTGVESKVDALRPDIVFVDGIYMMQDELGEAQGSSQALTNLTRGFKRMAKNRRIPVVISTQVLEWKMNKKKGITSDSIGYSSSFAQDSDVILGVERTEDDTIQKVKVVLARNCPPLETFVQWEWEYGRFEELNDDPFATPEEANTDGWQGSAY